MKRGVLAIAGIIVGLGWGFAEERLARPQASIPEGYQEVPFLETVAAPELDELEQQRGFLIFQRPITEPVYPNTHPRKHERVSVLEAFATAGEFEPVTFSLYPIRDLKNLKVGVSSLKGEDGEIEADQIDIRLVTYWNMGYPRYTSRESYRRVPELLERVTVHSSPAQECQRWWLTVQVPEGTKAGTYRGTVTLSDEVVTVPVEIPLSLKVLPFTLKSDPAKHYSAYYHARNKESFACKDEAFIDKATAYEYKAMRDYGLNMIPTLRLDYNHRERKLELLHEEEIERMLAAGLKGPIPVVGGITKLYRKYVAKIPVEKHWRIKETPSEEFYEAVTTVFREFEAERKEKGWPEMVYIPIDEVAESHQEFGARVYKALKEAGVRTYATKNPLAMDAAAYLPYLDVWCSQPFAMPYEKIAAQSRYEYWSYPNHIAGAIKNSRAMAKGGRMTYGFGFWRSGYTTLIPWHWAWTPYEDPFDYLRGSRSGTGQRFDENGEIIPAIYWQCFREGVDDERYLYTLQQAVWEREGSQDPDCEAAVARAKALLQQTWDAIDVQPRYLEAGMWPSAEFNARRWMLAQSISELQRYPGVRAGDAPSVLVPATERQEAAQEERTTIEQAIAAGQVQTLDLGEDFSQWRNMTDAGVIELGSMDGTGNKAGLRWKVQVDYDAPGGKGDQTLIGWSRIRRMFKAGRLDLSTWDAIEFKLRVDSNRDEVADGSTPLRFSIGSHLSGKGLGEAHYDLGDQQREWVTLRFSIAEMRASAGLGLEPWKSISFVQVFFSEREFPDKAKLVIDLAEVRLLRFTEPVLAGAEIERVVLLPRQWLPVPIDLMGKATVQAGKHRIKMALRNQEDGKLVLQNEWPLEASDQQQVDLEISTLRPGHYRWEVHLVNGQGEEQAEEALGVTGELEALAGPFFD